MTDQANTLARERDEMENQRDAVTALLANLGTANQESTPFSMIEHMVAGEAPLRVWREHRGFDSATLADKASVTPATTIDFEAGVEPSLATAAALAKALGIDAEELLPRN
jgi:mRNA interferase RelE/StbE